MTFSARVRAFSPFNRMVIFTLPAFLGVINPSLVTRAIFLELDLHDTMVLPGTSIRYSVPMRTFLVVLFVTASFFGAADPA